MEEGIAGKYIRILERNRNGKNSFRKAENEEYKTLFRMAKEALGIKHSIEKQIAFRKLHKIYGTKILFFAILDVSLWDSDKMEQGYYGALRYAANKMGKKEYNDKLENGNNSINLNEYAQEVQEEIDQRKDELKGRRKEVE